jgi:hypothetical protein
MVLPMRTAWRVLTGMMLAAAIAACGGGGGSDGGSTLPPMGNRAPTITSVGAVSVAEETAGVFHTVTASDPDGNALTFSLQGGTDQAQFRITSAGGLSFVTPPDFEAPADANRDNVYVVVVNVSDGSSNVTQTLSVTVTDVVTSGFRVRRVATGLDQPVFLAPVPDGTGRVFVVELPGRIRIMTPSTGAIAPTAVP